MKKHLPWMFSLLFSLYSGSSFSAEASGTGSMIAGPLIRTWADAFGMYSKGEKIKYQGSNPAAGIKSLLNKEVDFCATDMPLKVEELKKMISSSFPLRWGRSRQS